MKNLTRSELPRLSKVAFRRSLFSLVDSVEGGDLPALVLLHHGRPVAAVVPVERDGTPIMPPDLASLDRSPPVIMGGKP